MSLDALSSSLIELEVGDRQYLSVKEAGRRHRYHSDYLSQLCRSKKLDGVRVGRNWFVAKESLEAFVSAQRPQPPTTNASSNAPRGLFQRIKQAYRILTAREESSDQDDVAI